MDEDETLIKQEKQSSSWIKDEVKDDLKSNKLKKEGYNPNVAIPYMYDDAAVSKTSQQKSIEEFPFNRLEIPATDLIGGDQKDNGILSNFGAGRPFEKSHPLSLDKVSAQCFLVNALISQEANSNKNTNEMKDSDNILSQQEKPKPYLKKRNSNSLSDLLIGNQIQQSNKSSNYYESIKPGDLVFKEKQKCQTIQQDFNRSSISNRSSPLSRFFDTNKSQQNMLPATNSNQNQISTQYNNKSFRSSNNSFHSSFAPITQDYTQIQVKQNINQDKDKNINNQSSSINMIKPSSKRNQQQNFACFNKQNQLRINSEMNSSDQSSQPPVSGSNKAAKKNKISFQLNNKIHNQSSSSNSLKLSICLPSQKKQDPNRSAMFVHSNTRLEQSLSNPKPIQINNPTNPSVLKASPQDNFFLKEGIAPTSSLRQIENLSYYFQKKSSAFQSTDNNQQIEDSLDKNNVIWRQNSLFVDKKEEIIGETDNASTPSNKYYSSSNQFYKQSKGAQPYQKIYRNAASLHEKSDSNIKGSLMGNQIQTEQPYLSQHKKQQNAQRFPNALANKSSILPELNFKNQQGSSLTNRTSSLVPNIKQRKDKTQSASMHVLSTEAGTTSKNYLFQELPPVLLRRENSKNATKEGEIDAQANIGRHSEDEEEEEKEERKYDKEGYDLGEEQEISQNQDKAKEDISENETKKTSQTLNQQQVEKESSEEQSQSVRIAEQGQDTIDNKIETCRKPIEDNQAESTDNVKERDIIITAGIDIQGNMNIVKADQNLCNQNQQEEQIIPTKEEQNVNGILKEECGEQNIEQTNNNIIEIKERNEYLDSQVQVESSIPEESNKKEEQKEEQAAEIQEIKIINQRQETTDYLNRSNDDIIQQPARNEQKDSNTEKYQNNNENSSNNNDVPEAEIREKEEQTENSVKNNSSIDILKKQEDNEKNTDLQKQSLEIDSKSIISQGDQEQQQQQQTQQSMHVLALNDENLSQIPITDQQKNEETPKTEFEQENKESNNDRNREDTIMTGSKGMKEFMYNRTSGEISSISNSQELLDMSESSAGNYVPTEGLIKSDQMKSKCQINLLPIISQTTLQNLALEGEGESNPGTEDSLSDKRKTSLAYLCIQDNGSYDPAHHHHNQMSDKNNNNNNNIRSMTTVQEKSEVTSFISLPTKENIQDFRILSPSSRSDIMQTPSGKLQISSSQNIIEIPLKSQESSNLQPFIGESHPSLLLVSQSNHVDGLEGVFREQTGNDKEKQVGQVLKENNLKSNDIQTISCNNDKDKQEEIIQFKDVPHEREITDNNQQQLDLPAQMQLTLKDNLQQKSLATEEYLTQAYPNLVEHNIKNQSEMQTNQLPEDINIKDQTPTNHSNLIPTIKLLSLLENSGSPVSNEPNNKVPKEKYAFRNSLSVPCIKNEFSSSNNYKKNNNNNNEVSIQYGSPSHKLKTASLIPSFSSDNMLNPQNIMNNSSKPSENTVILKIPTTPTVAASKKQPAVSLQIPISQMDTDENAQKHEQQYLKQDSIIESDSQNSPKEHLSHSENLPLIQFPLAQMILKRSTKHEIFKGNSPNSDLLIKVVPPDNSTPLPQRKSHQSLTSFNFTDLDSDNSIEQSRTNSNNQQLTSNSTNNKNQQQQSSFSLAFSNSMQQEEHGLDGNTHISLKNIDSKQGIQGEEDMDKNQGNKDTIKDNQSNSRNAQRKLSRAAKSIDSSFFNKFQKIEENDQDKESYDKKRTGWSTTKHEGQSAKKKQKGSMSNTGYEESNSKLEDSNSMLNSQQYSFKNPTGSYLPESQRLLPSNARLEEISINSKRGSIDSSSSRRASILTPQQIKQVKKESKFFNKFGVHQNGSFIESDDPTIASIYGQDPTKYVDVKGLCDFKGFQSIQQEQQQSKKEENILNYGQLQQQQQSAATFTSLPLAGGGNTYTSLPDCSSKQHIFLGSHPGQQKYYQLQMRERFKKLMKEIDNSQHLALGEVVEDQRKLDTSFQKNAKTLSRKINQYFKTKYHVDPSAQEEKIDSKKRNSNSLDQFQKKKFNKQGIESKSTPGNANTLEQEDINVPVRSRKPSMGLKKSDLQKLNEKLQKRQKNSVFDKLLASEDVAINETNDLLKSDIEKQSTLDKINGVSQRNSKKRHSKKLVIQVNPPSEEAPSENKPQIKLDFAAIKKNNGYTYEFILNGDNNQELNDSSNTSYGETEDLDVDKQIQNQIEQQRSSPKNNSEGVEVTSQKTIHTKSPRNNNESIINLNNSSNQQEDKAAEQNNGFDFINTSQDSWNSQFLEQLNLGSIDHISSSNKGVFKNQFFQQDGNKSKRMSESFGISKPIRVQTNHSENQQQFSQQIKILQQDQKPQPVSSTLRFQDHNSWRFVKNYQISYLEKQIDKRFLSKVAQLRKFMVNLKNHFDPTNSFKLEEVIMPTQNNIIVKIDKSSPTNRSTSMSELLEIERQTAKNQVEQKICLIQHIFQEDLVNERYLEEKKRQVQSSNDSEDGSDDESDSSEEDEDKIILLSDGDKDLNDRAIYQYDEEDYEGIRSPYQLLEGYLEPNVISQPSNMFTQLNEFIVPVLSGIDSKYIQQILNYKIHHKIAPKPQHSAQGIFQEKLQKINRMVENLDSRSSQSNMKNIQSEYSDILEGEFQDDQMIDHDFYKKDFIRQQNLQFQQFMQMQHKMHQQGGNNKEQNSNNQITKNIARNKERSPRSNQSLTNVEMKLQPNSQTFQGQYATVMNLTQMQQNSANLPGQPPLAYQQYSSPYQRTPVLPVEPLFVNNNNLIGSNTNISNFSPKNSNTSKTATNFTGYMGNSGNPHLESIINKGFTQSLKNFAHQNPPFLQNVSTTATAVGAIRPTKTTEPLLISQVANQNTIDEETFKNKKASDSLAGNYAAQIYNKASSLQSQQSIFNQSESLQNRDAITTSSPNQSNETSKQATIHKASDYLLQKTNTNQSNEEKQLTAAGNNKKGDFPPIARKRSIFNTDSHLTHQLIQQQQLNQQQQQPQNIPSGSFLHRQIIRRYSQTALPNQQSPQGVGQSGFFGALQLTNNQAIVERGQSTPRQQQTLPLSPNNLFLQNNLQNGNFNHPLARQFPTDGSSTPIGMIASQSASNSQTKIPQSQTLIENVNTNNVVFVNTQQESNNNIANLNKSLKTLTVNKELDKSTSMERQNLVMRTRLQQNLIRNQMEQKDQIFSAIKENNIHEIEDLMNQFHSLSLESRDEEGNTFLIIAAQVGNKDIVDYFIQKGCNINAQNYDGDTALHKANYFSYHQAADLLILNGALQSKINNNGVNPWG